jgi:hypothetical protein
VADYRILVTGSRDWANAALLSFELGVAIGESGHPLADVVIVHGQCAAGADALADRLARDYGYRTEPHPADWNTWGKTAGFRRNAEMVSLGADVCLAFIRNASHGATHCANLTEKAGILTRRFEDNG